MPKSKRSAPHRSKRIPAERIGNATAGRNRRLISHTETTMQQRRLVAAVAAIVATLAIAPAKAEELVIWMRTNQPREDKALKQIISEFQAANPGNTVKLETRS